MNFIWVWNGKKIKQLSIIVIAAFFTAGLFYVERSELSVFNTPDGPQAFYKADIKEEKVALTFNISWGDHQAVPILDQLKEENVKATFFLSALWAERYPDIVKRIKEDGHEIGSHGYQYENYPSWKEDKIRKDIRQSHSILASLTGTKPTLLRPPNGQFDKKVLNIADSQGYTVVHWSVNSNDWENPGVNEIVSKVTTETKPGDVLLFHASDSVKQTDKALPIILKELRQKGYEFVTVTDLIASTNVKSEEIK